MRSIEGCLPRAGLDAFISGVTSSVARTRAGVLAGITSFRRWRKADDGVVAVEVGLLALPFFTLIVGIIAIGFMAWCHSTLDYATQKAARQIMTGAAQASNINAANFRTQTLCPYLPQGVFDCNNLVVNLKIVAESNEPTAWTNYVKSDFSGMITPPLDNAQNSFCMGAGNTYQVLEVLYPLPWYLGVLVSNPQVVQNQFIVMSTAAFKNEPFPGAASNPTGC